MSLDGGELEDLSPAELAALEEALSREGYAPAPSDLTPGNTTKASTGPLDKVKLREALEVQARESTVGADYLPYTKDRQKKERGGEREKSGGDTELSLLPNAATSSRKKVRKRVRRTVASGDEGGNSDTSTAFTPGTSCSHTAATSANAVEEEEQEEAALNQELEALLSGLSKEEIDALVLETAAPELVSKIAARGSKDKRATREREREGAEFEFESGLARLLNDDESFTHFNLNHFEGLGVDDTMARLCAGLLVSSHLVRLSLAHTRLTDPLCFQLTVALRGGTGGGSGSGSVGGAGSLCSLTSLNLETNSLSGASLVPLVAVLAPTIRELFLDNQRSLLGVGQEEKLVRELVKCKALVKLSLSFESAAARSTMDAFLMESVDRQRQLRLLDG